MASDDTRSPRLSAVTPRSLSIPRRSVRAAVVLILLFGVCTGVAGAQNETDPGTAFCSTDMAGTIQNLFTIIQFGGPLVGGVLALGATVAMPVVRRSDRKKGLRTIQMQGLLWGVIVAPLGTEIVQFILNNVVVGGTSCGF